MRLNLADIQTHFPGLYRHDKLIEARIEREWTERETARQSGISYGAIQRVFGGNAPPRKVWPVANALGVDWAELHNLKVKKSEFSSGGNGKKAAR